MLEIHQRSDTVGYERKIEGLENPIIIEAVNGENIDGYCVYTLYDGSVIFHDVEAGGDILLYDGIVRTALFKCSFIGIDKAKFLVEDLTMPKKLHLCDENGVLTSVSAVMNGCEHCKRN